MSLPDWNVLPPHFAEQLVAALKAEGRAFVRYSLDSGGPFIKVLTHEDMHCPTCQCNKLHPTPPVPDNPRSKSWHQNATTEPPK